MSEIRAVLFDAGGTLFTYTNLPAARQAAIPEYCRAMGLPESDAARVFEAVNVGLRRSLLEAERLPYYLHSDLTLLGYAYAAAALGTTISPVDADRIRRTIMAGTMSGTMRAGAAETLGELRRRGFHLGIVSNADEDQLALMVENFGFDAHFDAMLCSETARSCKPDAGIFRKALEQAGCAPAEAVFVGDTPLHDIAGARAVGMRTVLILEDTPMLARAATTAGSDTGGADHVIRELPELLEIIQ